MIFVLRAPLVLQHLGRFALEDLVEEGIRQKIGQAKHSVA